MSRSAAVNSGFQMSNIRIARGAICDLRLGFFFDRSHHYPFALRPRCVEYQKGKPAIAGY